MKGSRAVAVVQPGPLEGYTFASQVHPSVVNRVRKQDPSEYSIYTDPQQYTR